MNVTLKHTAAFFFGLVAVAAMGYAAYGSWYAIIPAIAVAFVYVRFINDMLWPERVTQRAECREARLAFKARMQSRSLGWLG